MESRPISTKLLLLDILFAIIIVALCFAAYSAVRKPKTDTSPGRLVETPRAFDSISVQAKAAYVYDAARNAVIYEKNETAQLPLASLTKLMTALTASDLLPRDSHITIRKEFLQEEGDSGLSADESWRLKDLLDFSLVMSSNDGARSIAAVVGAEGLKTADYDLGRQEFIAKMNERAKELGLVQTYFINESGLDEAGDTARQKTFPGSWHISWLIIRNSWRPPSIRRFPYRRSTKSI